MRTMFVSLYFSLVLVTGVTQHADGAPHELVVYANQNLDPSSAPLDMDDDQRNLKSFANLPASRFLLSFDLDGLPNSRALSYWQKTYPSFKLKQILRI
jgi:hypothetical protein